MYGCPPGKLSTGRWNRPLTRRSSLKIYRVALLYYTLSYKWMGGRVV
jgi:hypothetical protein